MGRSTEIIIVALTQKGVGWLTGWLAGWLANASLPGTHPAIVCVVGAWRLFLALHSLLLSLSSSPVIYLRYKGRLIASHGRKTERRKEKEEREREREREEKGSASQSVDGGDAPRWKGRLFVCRELLVRAQTSGNK